MSHTRTERLEALGRVIDTLDILRVKCPWDAKQTNENLRPNSIEEVYELADALMADDPANIRKELGDVLLHILFYSKIADEQGRFDIADVADALNSKLIFRHPHVFGQVQADNAQQVAENWEKIKLREKGGNRTVLSGVPSALPSLIKAFRIQEKAANADGDKAQVEAEFGDLLFAVVNAARLYGVNPDTALEHTNAKFIRRFGHIEACATAQGRSVADLSLDEMETAWQDAKKAE